MFCAFPILFAFPDYLLDNYLAYSMDIYRIYKKMMFKSCHDGQIKTIKETSASSVSRFLLRLSRLAFFAFGIENEIASCLAMTEM
jgi:hypothetical protein